MSNRKKQAGNNLINLIEDLQKKRNKAVEYILTLSAARKEEIIKESATPYNFDPGFADLIIDTLADLIIQNRAGKRAKREKDKDMLLKFEPVFRAIKPEIEKVFSAIKLVGF